MANYTTNLELEKPLVTEAYDINVFNGNMDKIDAEFIKKLNIEEKATAQEALAGINDSKYITSYSLSSVVGNLVTQIQGAVENLLLERDKQKYHIGKLVFETSNTNPATYLGFGTWELWGAGRVPVGVNLEDIDFNEVEKIGGSKYLQSHTHTMKKAGEHNHNVKFDQVFNTNGGTTSLGTVGGGPYGSNVFIENAGKHEHEINSSGTGDSGNLQPYITCYIWKRVS